MEVKHCRAQHDALVSFIRYNLQTWGPWDELPLSYWSDPTSDRANRLYRTKVTPELKLVLTRARVLSEECCRPSPPLVAALRHGDRSQAFTDILKEIQWFLTVVSHGRKCETVVDKSSPELKEFPWEAKIGHYEQELLEIAEQEDWRNVLEELKEWASDHECSAEQCGNMHGRTRDDVFCLPARFIEKWTEQGSSSDYSNHLSMLFSFDEEILVHGRPLGSGAFGAVSKATWLGIEFAQKIFSSGGSTSLLRAEAEALANLNHPHIVKVHACSENSLLLDLMCTDLYKFIKARMRERARDQPFSLPVAMDLILQIADAVSYLHTQGMAHRDLKSSNILVDPVFTCGDDVENGYVHVKIADFGLAKVKHEITSYSHLTHNIGTRTYMAPEIFGANEDDEHLEHAYPMKADVYSFGVICSEILTGEEPYNGVARSMLYRKLTGPIPLRPQLPLDCPTALASLICSCWDADPRERPTFADVCRVLRYLKGIQIMHGMEDSSRNPIDGSHGTWPFGRLPPLMKMEDFSYRYDDDGLHDHSLIDPTAQISGPLAADLLPLPLDIQGVKVTFVNYTTKILVGFTVAGFSGGQWVEQYVCMEHYDHDGFSTNWIMFDYPSEYLVQVEVSCENMYATSVTFITTKQKYGPYGEVYPSNTKLLFPQSPKRIVGFSESPLKIFVIEDIVRCLHDYSS